MESKSGTCVEQLAEHEQELNALKMQKKAAKKERDAERKLAYLKSSLSEKTYFRYIVVCVVAFLLETALLELVKPDEFKLIGSVFTILHFLLLWWFGHGRSKTHIGAMIQTVVKWIGYVINGAALFYFVSA